MGFGNMKKCCCFPLAIACILAAVFYGISTTLLVFSKNEGKFLMFVFNVAIILLLILGLILKNWVMFAILTVLCACETFFSIILFIVVLIGLISVGSTLGEGALIFAIIALLGIVLSILVSLLCLNICYSMCKILQQGGTGWEGKSAKEIEKEKESENKVNQMENGQTAELQNHEQHTVQ